MFRFFLLVLQRLAFTCSRSASQEASGLNNTSLKNWVFPQSLKTTCGAYMRTSDLPAQSLSCVVQPLFVGVF